LIDVDPKRPSGISSTAEEKAAAAKKIREIHSFLKTLGWPEPVKGDSGNGYHMEYSIDLPAEDGGLIGKLLVGLASRFDDDVVQLDRTVFNSARIVKLYGTLSCKGDNTEERPHRMSKLLKVPHPLQRVSREQLEKLAKELAPPEPEPASGGRPGTGFDVDAFSARHGVEVVEKFVDSQGRTIWQLKNCVFNPDHVDGEAAIVRHPSGVLGYECKHTSCVDKHWEDYRRLLEPDYDRKTGDSTKHATAKGEQDEEQELTSLTSLDAADFPAPLEKTAFHGLAGDFVRRVLPYTEADEAALLYQFLGGFGNLINRTAHMIAEGASHYCNNNVTLVGPTSKGRKGSAWWHVLRILRFVDEHWVDECIASGLSTGEGLIWAVRDPITKTVQKKEKGKGGKKKKDQYVETIVDPGVSDKRLMVVETEFSTVLKVMSREGNTLSAVIRNAWDGVRVLRTLTKNSPARATDAHISIISHITREELSRDLTDTESANGFGNRFNWVAVRRSKCLPEGGEAVAIADLVMRIKKAVEFAKKTGELKRDEAARRLWAEVYPKLSEGRPGLLGAITARQEAQVLRFSEKYALLDCSNAVCVEHLKAALAVCRYCEDSARWVFGTRTGNKNADRILAALKAAGEKGLSKWEINRDVFNRNATRFDINEALRILYHAGFTDRKIERTRTRPSERWFYKSSTHEEYEESTAEAADTSYSSCSSASKNTSSKPVSASEPADVSSEVDAFVPQQAATGKLRL
jgi:hypothetical protein